MAERIDRGIATDQRACWYCRFACRFDHSVYCHRFPPVRRITGEPREWTMRDWEFPLLAEYGWCGEWRGEEK